VKDRRKNTDRERFSAIGPYRGMCAVCGAPDARHRVADAVVAMVKSGEPISEVAQEYGLTEDSVRRIVGRME